MFSVVYVLLFTGAGDGKGMVREVAHPYPGQLGSYSNLPFPARDRVAWPPGPEWSVGRWPPG